MLSVYSIEQNEQWDTIVRSFPNYDVYYLSGYVKAFKIHGDGEPLLFFYEDRETRGINVVMKRDIAMDSHFIGKLTQGQFFDFSTPYGYGGWLIEGASDEVLCAYEKWCEKNNVISEIVRFHPVLENYVFSVSDYEIVCLGKTVTIDLASPETIWNNLTSKNRNMIRKAKKSGIEIYNGRYPEIFDIFQNIYNETMKRDQARTYYFFEEKFYNSILKDLPQNAQVFYAVLDDQVIAASIFLTANCKMNYHLSGSLKEYSHYAPSNLLLYKASLWGSANGYRTLYLGGGVGGGEDSLFAFKKSFSRQDDLKNFYIGKKTFNQEKYDEIVNMRLVLPESGFFPKYRA